MKKLLILFLFSTPAFATDRYCPPETTTNTSLIIKKDNDEKYLIGAAVVGIGICLWNKCWKDEPVQIEDKKSLNLTPDFTPDFKDQRYIIEAR